MITLEMAREMNTRIYGRICGMHKTGCLEDMPSMRVVISNRRGKTTILLPEWDWPELKYGILLSVLVYLEEVFEVCIVDESTRQETVIMERENSEDEGHKIRNSKD